MAAGMIQLKNVSKTFHIGAKRPASRSGGTAQAQDVYAVRDVSLEVDEGDIFGVIGFSGAGKSTLVRCINLLERPDKGEVLVKNRDLTRMPERELRRARKDIGMIFQHFNLFRSRTVEGNVAFPLRYTGLSKESIRKRVFDLLDVVGLANKGRAYPSELSGGQKQRVGIARALASNPSILLCDEATSALDPQTTQAILALLRDLNKKLGITIVIITHEMQIIKSICRHAAVMDQGSVIEQGSVFDIFSNPQTKITQDFIATTSHLNRIYEFLANDTPFTRLKNGQILAYFRYTGPNTIDALISIASINFGVNLNILFGDLDIIDGKPLGGLILVLEGEAAALHETLAWFNGRGVRTEILKHG